MGVQGLQRSLVLVGARHPLLVMYTPDTLSRAAAEALRREGCSMRAVNRYTPPPSVDHRAYKLAAYADCWTKLRMWEWEGEFERLVYLDADMLVLKNIDHLFDLPPGFYAAPDCAAGRRTQAERDDCALLRPAGQRPHYFNAGMFAMAPSRAQLAGFHAALATGAARVGSYAEQDLLNHQLKDEWVPLPQTFNLQKGIMRHHPELWAPQQASIIHYTDRKPWDDPQHADHAGYADIVGLWWRVYRSGGGRRRAGPLLRC